MIEDPRAMPDQATRERERQRSSVELLSLLGHFLLVVVSERVGVHGVSIDVRCVRQRVTHHSARGEGPFEAGRIGMKEPFP
jgi:hypothetical protein